MFEYVMQVVNFIRSHGLNQRQFQSLLLETDADYGDILYHTEVWWLNHERMLERSLASRLKI